MKVIVNNTSSFDDVLAMSLASRAFQLLKTEKDYSLDSVVKSMINVDDELCAIMVAFKQNKKSLTITLWDGEIDES